MVRTIVRDPLFLNQKSVLAVPEDRQVLLDLMDTLKANQEHCVGMAANMIGVRKRIIAFFVGPVCIGMYNPEIVKRNGPYEAEEGCLSLTGLRKTIRYRCIEVSYCDEHFRQQKTTYSGWIAQIIQHEVDHCNGILI